MAMFTKPHPGVVEITRAGGDVSFLPIIISPAGQVVWKGDRYREDPYQAMHLAEEKFANFGETLRAAGMKETLSALVREIERTELAGLIDSDAVKRARELIG